MAKESDKCRTSKIIRYGDETCWVDVEVLTHASFKGAQWKGPDKGNLGQETIMTLDEDLTNTGGDIVTISMKAGNGRSVDLRSKGSARFSTRYGHVERFFSNTNKNDCREDDKKRLRFNHIDEEFYENGKPPEQPKKYKKAVSETKDGSDIYLDVYINKKARLMRAKDNPKTAIDFTKIWGSGNVGLPGGGKNTNPKNQHVRVDPYQAIVNFGPDGYAVQFFEGDGPAYKRERN